MGEDRWYWPSTGEELVELQGRLALAADAAEPWLPPARPVVVGCHASFAGTRGWAAAVAWRPPPSIPTQGRSLHRQLRHAAGAGEPRRAADVLGQSVVAGSVSAEYVAGLLALREGPLLAGAIAALDVEPDVVLVDATGADHPRRAGLALHLGAVIGAPTVGATKRPLIASGATPELHRGAFAPMHVDDRWVASWVCTRTGARPIVAHAGWRTTAKTAVDLVLATSTPSARTPVPLQEARRVAREARALVS